MAPGRLHIEFARQKEASSTFVEADRFIRLDEVRNFTKLREGDQIVGGRIVDREGHPVRVHRKANEIVDVQVGEAEQEASH